MALTPKRLFLSLCISISLLRSYTFFSRSPLVFKTLNFRMSGSSDLSYMREIFVQPLTAADSLTCSELFVCILFSYGSRRLLNNVKIKCIRNTPDLQYYVCTKAESVKGEVRRKMNFTCVRVCGVEGRGKSLSGQFFFVCEKTTGRNRARSHSGA